MNIRFNAAIIGVGVALAGVAVLPALADEWNKETIFTFNEPVEVPGHVLIPGTYVFQLEDSLADRNIVQIFSEDKKKNEHIVTTVLAIPDFHMKVSDKPTLSFEERHANSPEAIKSWFYPGENYGWEFVYPKSERLEEAVAKPAPAAPAPAPVAQPPVTVQNQPQPMAIPAAAQTPARREEVVIAQSIVPAAPTPAQAPKTRPHRLPKTASDLPLVELAGGLSLLAGLLVFRFAPASTQN